jgi:hypothetical protein
MAEGINTYQGEGVNQAGSPEHIHDMLAKVESPIELSDVGLSDDPPVSQEQDRPEWLPEKFGSPEELAQAYKSLEQKFHGNEEEQSQQEEERKFQEEGVPDILGSTPSQIHKVLDDRGLDFSVFQDEYTNTGSLSDDAFKALDEVGIGKEVVETWISGQEAMAEQNMQGLYDLTGGDANYNQMLEWANTNLQQGEAEAYNKQIDNLDATSQLAVAGLFARYQQSEGAMPSLISGDVNVSTQPRYESLAQITSAMSDPRYETDPAYRAQVAGRLNNSSVL